MTLTRLAAAALTAAACLALLNAPASAAGAAAAWGPITSPGGVASARGKVESVDEDNSFQAKLTRHKAGCAWLVVEVREDVSDWHTLRYSQCSPGSREIHETFYEANWIKVKVCDGTAAKPVTCTPLRKLNLGAI